jgi:multicomponent Na+:H+ antiporter subunit G
MISSLGWLLCLAGGVTIIIAAIGILRLPDALSRQHASTKAGTVAVMLVVVGTMMIVQETEWTWRLLVILLLLFLTLPLASHALTRAAYREMTDNEKSHG